MSATLILHVFISHQTMIKNKLVAPTLQMLFVLMAEEEEEEDDDEDEEDHIESSKPSTVAAQTLNEMALHLPPDKIVNPLLQWAEPAIKSNQIILSLAERKKRRRLLI